MAVMSGNLYRALTSVNVEHDLAQKAAEEVASFDDKISTVKTDIAVLKWMVGVLTAANTGVLVTVVVKVLL